MGSWISNISIRKNGNISMDDVAGYLSQMASERQYEPAASEEEADGAFAIIADENAQWFTICSDLISLEDPELFPEIATPMSARLHTDVLGIACFDSDYLYLNLINAEDQTDAWIGIGSAAGLDIKRRSGLKAWKKKVADFPAFSACAKQAYICTEEFLVDAEPCLGLPAAQSSVVYEYLKDLGLDKNARYLYFKLPDEMKNKEPTKLVPFMYDLMPCSLDKPTVVNGLNIGSESRGMSVYFLGPYVESEEITFSDVCFVKFKNNQVDINPFELKKMQLADGQWVYYYHDPGFRIPPKVDDRLPQSKQMRVEFERSIGVRFIPHGNPRKLLDITVALVPDKNPQGQTSWNVWRGWGSKKAFIDRYNQIQDQFREQCPSPNMARSHLREEDFE